LTERHEHNPIEERSEAEAGRALKVLDALAAEWTDLNWRTTELTAAVRDEVKQPADRDGERLKRLQVALEEIRLKQQFLLERQVTVERELFTRLGL